MAKVLMYILILLSIMNISATFGDIGDQDTLKPDFHRYKCGMTKEEMEKLEGKKLYTFKHGDLTVYCLHVIKYEGLNTRVIYDFKNNKLEEASFFS